MKKQQTLVTGCGPSVFGLSVDRCRAGGRASKQQASKHLRTGMSHGRGRVIGKVTCL